MSGLALDLLTLTVSAPTSVAAGQTFAYTYTIANPGTVGGATGVTLTDPLPSGVGFVSATASQGTCGLTGSTVTCALGPIPALAAATVTLNVTAPSSSAVVTNSATVTENEVDPVPTDNTAAATTFVNGADMSVTAAASPSPAPAGSLLTYTLTVNNAGSAIATGATVTDTLPQGITVQSVGTTRGSCSQGAGAVTCPLGTLAVGGTATVTIVVVPTGLVPKLADVATVTATNPDPNPGNNTAALQTTVSGAVGGISTVVQFGQPTDAVRDAVGNTYFTNLPSDDVMKLDTSGILSIFAGNGSSGFSGDGGPANQAGLDQPFGLLFDSSGNLYIADQGFPNRIRKVDPSGVITTFAGNGSGGPSGDGGPATAAGFNPQYMVITSAGFFFTDCNNNNVRKIDGAGIISTFASGISCPEGITADPGGNLYVAANSSNVVDKIDTSGTVTVVAGNGTAGYSGDGGAATAAAINAPYGVAYSGGLFIAQYGSGSSAVRKVDLAGTITTVAGNGTDGYSGDGGAATAAQLNGPTGLHFDKTDLLIAEYRGFVVRQVAKLGPDLLSLTVGAPATVASGSQYSYVQTVTNPGTAGGATGVTLTDPLPSGVGFVSATATQGTCGHTGTTVTCPLGQIPALTFAQVTVTVTAPAASTAVANTATVTENEVDPVPGDNTASATTYVDPADLSVTGTASPNPVVAGQVLSETWSVQNAGPLGATGVQLTEQVQAGVSIRSTSASQGTCTASGQKVTCQLGLLANGGSATVAVGLVPAANVVSVTDTATVSGNQVDQNPANNTATAQASVVLGVATQFTNPGNTPIIPGLEVPFQAGITAGADGNMWYARLFPNFGEYQSQIGRVTTKGVYQPAFTADQGFAQDMVLGPDGNVWFSEAGFSGDPGGQSVGRITPQGKVTLFPMPCGSSNCSGTNLTVGPDGNIWFPTMDSTGANGIGRIDIKTGTMKFFPTSGGEPFGLTTGPDGNLWFTTFTGIGRMTPSGVSTSFTVPSVPSCSGGQGNIVTGPDHLLWVVVFCGNSTLLVALNVAGAQPSLDAQFSFGSPIGDITSGPDAVYFSLYGSGPVIIGRATTAGVLFYSTGTAGFVQKLAMGPDGNIWFTDFVTPDTGTTLATMGIGHISPPPSGTESGPVIGHLNPTSTHANKSKAPKLAAGSNNIRKPKPPPITGAACADVINPANFTTINGDVTVNDSGFGCILSQVTVNGNVHVTAGAFADLSFSTVNGSVIVDSGGQVHMVGSHVTGSVTGTGGSFITMFNSKVDLNVTSTPSQYGTAMVCGSTIGGNLTDSGATDTTSPSVVGDPTGSIPCPGNKIAGSLTLSGNSEQILVDGNNVTGAIVVTNNPSTAAFDLRNNNAASLSCSGNAVAPTGGGNHGAESGQCAKL